MAFSAQSASRLADLLVINEISEGKTILLPAQGRYDHLAKMRHEKNIS
jgi:hypothetical protein